MNWKGTLTGILASIVIASSGCRTIQIHQQRNQIKQISSFDNNNLSLEDHLVPETAQSVEKINVIATYSNSDEEMVIGKSGSSTILDENNNYYHVLTAYHVIEMPKIILETNLTNLNLEGINLQKVLSSTTTLKNEISIKVAGIEAEVVCYDQILDYALLRIPSNGKLFPLTKNKNVYLSNTDIIERGDYVYVMGYPLGLDLLVTDGVVSNVRFPEHLSELFKVYRNDAFMFTGSISPGNSGGPVFTISEGNLYFVGVVSRNYPAGNDLNIAFKINKILDNIRAKGFDIQKLNTKILQSYHKTKLD